MEPVQCGTCRNTLTSRMSFEIDWMRSASNVVILVPRIGEVVTCCRCGGPEQRGLSVERSDPSGYRIMGAEDLFLGLAWMQIMRRGIESMLRLFTGPSR